MDLATHELLLDDPQMRPYVATYVDQSGITRTVIRQSASDRVRITFFEHDPAGQRLLLRYVVGRIVGDAFEAPTDDAGVSFLGEGYRTAGFARQDPLTTLYVLEQTQAFLNTVSPGVWDGTIREIA